MPDPIPNPTDDDLLIDFEVWADDVVLSLYHRPCGERVCDVEHNDTLLVLVEVARDHRCTT